MFSTNSWRILVAAEFRLIAACVVCPVVVGPSTAAAQAISPTGTRATEQWTVTRDLVIGEPRATLTVVGDVLVGADGSIFVTQPQDQQVLTFAPDGELVRTIGRRGRGPGEFLDPESLGWWADTLVVGDRGLGRISAFDPGGKLHYTVTTLVRTSVPHRPLGILANGLIVAEQSPGSDDLIVDGAVTVRPLLLLDREGATVGHLHSLSIGRHDRARVVIRVGGEPTYSFFLHPFPDSDLYDVDPEGRGVVAVSQAGVNGSEPQFAVAWLTPSGERRWTKVFSYTPQPSSAMTRDTMAALVDKFTQHPSFHGVPRGQIERSIRRDIDLPAFLAPVSAVVVGSDGTIWLRREPVAADAMWMVLDDRGVPIAEVRMPFDLRVQVGKPRTARATDSGPAPKVNAGDPSSGETLIDV